MAFRQHNPNILPSRREDESSWKVTKSSGASNPFQHGPKVSLPPDQQVIQHQRDQTPSDEMSRCWGRSSLLADETYFQGSISGLHRIRTLSRESIRPGTIEGTRTNSKRLPSEPFRLEKLNRLGNSATSQEFFGANCPEVPQPTGYSKYVEAARSTMSMTTQPFNLFNDNDADHTQKEIKSTMTPSKAVHEYVQKLHLFADTGDSRSAHEAEVLLLEMIDNHKAGLHDFQPDGGCYNRYDGSTVLFIRCIFLHCTLNNNV